MLLPEGAAAFHLAVGLDSAPDCLTGLLLEYGANPNIQYVEALPFHNDLTCTLVSCVMTRQVIFVPVSFVI